MNRAALLWLMLLLQVTSLQVASPFAQESPAATFPERLRYVFDLPWCKAWQFACARCAKEPSGSISCTSSPCTGNHEFFWCADFAVDPQCTAWLDGCNRCSWDKAGHARCTARACFDYRPRFTCTATQQQH